MRIFTSTGEKLYQEWVLRFCAKETKGQGEVPFHLLSSDATSTDLGTPTPDSARSFANKYDFITYLKPFIDACLAKVSQKMDEQRRVWDAFALMFFDTICPKDENGAYAPSMFAHYMIDDEGRSLMPHYQRHRIYDPYRFVQTNQMAIKPFFESDAPSVGGNLEEDFGGRQEYVSNAALLSLLNYLYVGNDGHPIKGFFAVAQRVPGTRVKQCKPGSLRRLTAAIRQLKCNYNVLQCATLDMMNVLPEEFRNWYKEKHEEA